MKDLKNLQGAKMLSKMEQKDIKGGKEACDIFGHDCHDPWDYCQFYNETNGICVQLPPVI